MNPRLHCFVPNFATLGFLATLLLVIGGCASTKTADSASRGHVCIRGGDESAINAALSGPGARAVLCPRAIFRVSHPIVLSADEQQIYTDGLPTDDSRAHIVVVSNQVSSALVSNRSGIAIHHLIIEGGRSSLGRDAKGGALIDVGGDVSGVQVHHVKASDPRGWSVLHVFEGSKKCSNAKIFDNELGPAGHPNGEWADGISFACRDSIIERNVITDPSDGGIVIFGAPGTIVRNNTVRTTSNFLLGGINLVDYRPYDGDYSRTIVRNNRIEARGGFIRIGIAIGPSVWSRAVDQINRGGVVENNILVGDHFGYGIAVQGVQDFTVRGNIADGHFGGVHGARCPPQTQPMGGAFVKNSHLSTGNFDAQFAEGDLTVAVCIEPQP